MDRVKKNKKKGFTLVELMIVIVIMVILAAAATPVFTGYMRKARATKHLADCRSIYTAAQTYIEEVKASKKDLTNFDVADIDPEGLKAEIKSLSTFDVDEITTDDGTPSKTYGYHLKLDDTSDKRGVYCDFVVYKGDANDGVWVFNTTNGTFTEKVTTK